jgi:hypothetical protein
MESRLQKTSCDDDNVDYVDYEHWCHYYDDSPFR